MQRSRVGNVKIEISSSLWRSKKPNGLVVGVFGTSGGCVANILVLEDERAVRTFFALVLRQNRHTVWEAATADEAEQKLREHPVDIAVVDITLEGGKSGTDFALALIESHAHVRVLFVSGWPAEQWRENDMENIQKMPESSYAMLSKPFLPEALVRKVQELLVRGRWRTA